MNNNKLTGKDLITVGIYTALYTICVFITGMFNAIPIFYPIFMFIGPIVTAIPMTLYYTKIEKFGMITISGIIMGAFWYICGYTWISLVCILPTALLADILYKALGHKKFFSMVVSYIFFSMGLLAGPANLWFAGVSYWDGIRESMGDQYAEQLAKYMPTWFMPLAIVLIALGAVKYFVLFSLAAFIHVHRVSIQLNMFLNMIVVLLGGLVLKLAPAFACSDYILKSTTVSEVIAAMSKMKVSRKIMIPVSVIFRFFPTMRQQALDWKMG